MLQHSYSLTELADATGIEERTIRSYIERGLLPGAQTRGRAASYSKEHLSRLQVIKSLRRARPGIGLSEIRIVLQGLSPEQIDHLATGAITATPRHIGVAPEAGECLEPASEDEVDVPHSLTWGLSATKLTGVERLVSILREISGAGPAMSATKLERWQRIAITPDIELSIRGEFDTATLSAFRELADLFRNLIQRADALSTKGDE